MEGLPSSAPILTKKSKMKWEEEVRMAWFDAPDTEVAEAFLDRAEKCLKERFLPQDSWQAIQDAQLCRLLPKG